MGEEGVLLSFIETVNFVDKKNGADFEIPVGFGALYDFFDIAFFGGDSGDFNEVGVEFACENASEGGFAGAGWSPENEIDWLALFNDFSENFAVANNLVLTQDFVQRFWAHALG